MEDKKNNEKEKEKRKRKKKKLTLHETLKSKKFCNMHKVKI